MFKIMLTSTWNKGIERARTRTDALFKTIEHLTLECDRKDATISLQIQNILNLQADLAEARKNDQRDPASGRFVTAKELDAAKKS